jgi:hypothetical protein
VLQHVADWASKKKRVAKNFAPFKSLQSAALACSAELEEEAREAAELLKAAAAEKAAASPKTKKD